MRTQRRLNMIVLACVLVVVAGAAAAFVVTRASGSPPPSLSVFNNPADAFPVDIRSDTDLHQRLAQPLDARLAKTDGSDRYYVLRGQDDTVCLEKVTMSTDVGPVVSGTCGAASALANDSIFAIYPQPNGTLDVAGIAKDGFSKAAVSGRPAVAVSKNVFLIHGARPFAFLDLSGPAGSAHVHTGVEDLHIPSH
jgi:hypothetical protein